MSFESLDVAIQRAGSAVELLRNSQYPAIELPIAPEFSNWRTEQMAWRETCVLMDQSHHMSKLSISGPDALRAISEHGVNSFEGFRPGMAKQYVVVNKDGYYVGDGILFYLDEQSFDLIANPSAINWMQFHLEAGNYNAVAEREDNSNRREGPPKLYRYELQGPQVRPLVEKLIGRSLPAVKFFGMTELKIAGKTVRALRHGMAGQPGFEIFGPWNQGQQVLDAILAAGGQFGLMRAGAKSYSTANLESGWMPRPMTGIFGPHETAYRRWLPATAVGSLGGSMDSATITDYYHTPYDIGYGRLVKFDHDFVGRDALERIAKEPRRTKVTLVWNTDDVMSVIRSHFEPGTPAKFIEVPKARYAYFQVDKVSHKGKYAGMSTDVGYITNERAFISLASIDVALGQPGTRVSVLWGEKPNSIKPAVEPHRQVEIRAEVAPVPYAQVIRDSYRDS